MEQSSHRVSHSAAGENAEVRDWLQEAAACLVNPCRSLPLPPLPELRQTYEAVLNARKQVEQSRHELIESTQIQSLHAVGSILAHDLHNLSLRLALLSQNLEQFYGDPAFLESAKHVLSDTVERMQNLVDGFRQRQETVIIKIPTDINEVLRTLVRQMDLASASRIEFRAEYGATSPIWADSFFLANAFRVLIENAIDAMPDGGLLIISTSNGPEGNPVLEIEDTGIGMTPEFIARELFAPFRSNKGRGGLGLGMYICQHIIQLHDGEMELESQPGCGTRFRLVFPAAQKP